MLIYKQRYKPRTSRAFTKSDLAVYDSAGNTALNALTVYGKSEVVDGTIKSAGEGWSTVDLGTLNWGLTQAADYEVFEAPITTIKVPSTAEERLEGIMCKKYPISQYPSFSTMNNKSILRIGGKIVAKDSTYADAATFKSAMSGVMLAYELRDPTQGNTIAIKTDNGTGINGTMAVFSTGTPLRGIPDTDVRDVMVWNGSAGTVTKNCGKIRLTDLTWNYNSDRQYFYANLSVSAINADNKINGICSIYTADTLDNVYRMTAENKSIGVSGTRTYVKDTNYTTPTDFVASLGDAELVYEVASPTTEQLTTAENDSIAGLRTFTPQTHAQNNAQTEMTIDYTIRAPTI